MTHRAYHANRRPPSGRVTLVTIFAELDGHAFDLDALLRHFPTGDPHIMVVEDGTYLATDLDDLRSDAARLLDAAGEQLDRLNGYAWLLDGAYQRVRLNGRFFCDPDRTTGLIVAGDTFQFRESFTVVQAQCAEARGMAFSAAAVTDGAPSTPPPPPGPERLAQAATNKDLDDLLDLVGKAEKLSWIELYKVFEIIRVAVGGRDRNLLATGWTTKSELSAFTGTANHHLASGIHEGRHARQSGDAPKHTISLGEAQAFIRGLVCRWLDSLR